MNVRLQLFGLEETILRPIIIQTLRDISKEIGCLTKPYLHIDDNSAIKKTQGVNKNQFSTNSNSPIKKFSGKTKEMLRVTNMNDAVTPGQEIDYRINYPETKPFLNDPEIGFSVRTIIQERKLDLSIEYTTTDKAYLNSIINSLKVLPTTTECRMLHDLEYKLFLPSNIKRLLGHIYLRKKKRWTDEELLTFRDYITLIADDRLTDFVSHSSSVDGFKFGIQEKLVEVLGVMSTDVHSLKPEATDDGYSIEFDYSIYYQMPIALDVRYPLVVFNSLISKKDMNFTPRTGRSYVENSTADLAGLRKHFLNPMASEYMGTLSSYVKIPSRDDTMPTTFPSRYVRLLTTLFLVSDQDRRDVMNLDQIQGVSFKHFIKEFILKSEFEFITKQDRSFIYITLYENDILLHNVLEMDESGNIRTNFDMNLKKTYRMVVFLLKDLDYLSKVDRARTTNFLKSNLIPSRNFCNYEKEKLKKDYKNGNTGLKIQIMTIDNRYLSSLDAFKEIYGLTDEDIVKVENRYGRGVDIVDIIKYSKIKTPKTQQIYKTAIYNLFD